MQTHERPWGSQVGDDQIAPPTPSDCCSVEFASASVDTCLSASREQGDLVRADPGVATQPSWWDTQAPRPDFSVAISRRLGMIVVAVHGALSPTSSAQLRQILLDLVDHLATGTSSSTSET